MPFPAAAIAGLLVSGCTPSSPSTPSPSPTSLAIASSVSLQQAFVDVVKHVEPKVVQIETSSGLGSGIVFDDNGDIITNNHVVGSARTFRVTLDNGKQYPGTLVGTFPPDDLAMIHIGASGLHPATFADSTKVQVGEIVLAIGNPLGLQSSVTEGIVSAVGRTVSEGQTGAILPDVIQTSAAINPGNSGGALVDLTGQVVGIPTLAALDPQLGGGSAPGIGFAISSSVAHDIGAQIVQYGHVVNSHRAYLGVRFLSVTASSGAQVASVQPGGPADKAGIQAGDLITAVAGKPTPNPAGVASALAGLQPGQAVKVDLVHADGSKNSVTITLGQIPGT